MREMSSRFEIWLQKRTRKLRQALRLNNLHFVKLLCYKLFGWSQLGMGSILTQKNILDITKALWAQILNIKDIHHT